MQESMQVQTNTWNELCGLTTALFPKYGSRPEAFRAACKQRPDLAERATDPLGAPVVARKGCAPVKADPLEQLKQLAEKRAAADGIDYHRAYALVVASAEGARLYQQYIDSKQ